MKPDRRGPPSAQTPDESGWGLFSELFVDTELAKDGLERLIAELLDAAIERHGFVAWVVGPHYIIEVFRNKRVRAPTDQQPREFVDWPYYLEIDAEAEQTRQAQIALVTRLLTGLWERGLGAVVACDFEAELPQRGGYNPAQPRNQR